jgi:hypothetical protein
MVALVASHYVILLADNDPVHEALNLVEYVFAAPEFQDFFVAKQRKVNLTIVFPPQIIKHDY